MYDMPDVLKEHKGLTILMNNIITNDLIHRSLKERDMYCV